MEKDIFNLNNKIYSNNNNIMLEIINELNIIRNYSQDNLIILFFIHMGFKSLTQSVNSNQNFQNQYYILAKNILYKKWPKSKDYMNQGFYEICYSTFRKCN